MTTEDNKSLIYIFELISEGQSMRSACEVADFRRSKFYELLKEEKEGKSTDLLDQYTCAREDRQTKIFEEILEISDDGSKDKSNPLAVQRAKLQTDARKWMLGKMNPNKYGDKIQHTGDEENPIKIVKTIIVK